MAMGDSVLQSHRREKIPWGTQGVPASITCPVVAGIPWLPEQAGDVGGCAGLWKAWGVRIWCVGRQAHVCAHLCTHVSIQLPFCPGF